jgi:hypothetical protein
MDDQRTARVFRGEAVAHNHDVRQVRRDDTRDEIARQIISVRICHRQLFPLPLKKTHKIWHAPMIDVSIRSAEAPLPWIRGKRTLHVLVHGFLKIEPGLAHRTHDDVRAHSAIDRNVASWVVELRIRCVISDRHANLRTSCEEEIKGWRSKGRDNKDGEQEQETHGPVRQLNAPNVRADSSMTVPTAGIAVTNRLQHRARQPPARRHQPAALALSADCPR